MKEAAEQKLRAWLNAPFEEIQRDLETIEALRGLTTDDLDQLIAIGRVMADERKIPTRGRPKGSKTKVKGVSDGQGS